MSRIFDLSDLDAAMSIIEVKIFMEGTYEESGERTGEARTIMAFFRGEDGSIYHGKLNFKNTELGGDKPLLLLMQHEAYAEMKASQGDKDAIAFVWKGR